MALNRRKLRLLKPDEWLSDGAGRGAPSLRAKGSPTGVPRYYLRYVDSKARRIDLTLGAFDRVEDAEARAAELVARWRAGERDLREALQAEEAAAEAAKRASEAAKRADEARKSNTVGKVLGAYCDRLDRDAKASAAQVRKMLARHVEPTRYWTMPALDFTAEHAVAVLAPLVEAGHEREAQKLRAALRAAFKRAAEAATDPKASADLRAIGLRADPLSALRTIERRDPGTRERALSPDEWRRLWVALKDEPASDAALLRLHVLLGAPRVEQLARCTLADFDTEAKTLKMLDGKGRRTRPRVHLVPVIEAAARELATMHGGGSLGPHLFTLDRGASAAPYNAIAHRWRALSRRLVAEGALSAPVTPGDIRRSVETQLARLGVPGEVRAVLQSHGLGGVVWKHYQRHDFLNEMRRALDQLADFLAKGRGATVVPLRGKRTKARAG